MAISRVGLGGISEGTATTFNVAYPTVAGGILSTDFLVLFSFLGSLSAPGVPAGWVQRASADSGGSTPMVRGYTVQPAGGESGTMAVTKPALNGKMFMAAYRGVDLTNPIDVDTSTGPNYSSSAASLAYTIPTFNTVTDGAALLVAGCANASTGTWTQPSVPAAFTELVDTNGVSAAVPSICFDELIWSSHGATGAINLTRTTSIRGGAIVIALRPAVPAVSPVFRRDPSRGLYMR